MQWRRELPPTLADLRPSDIVDIAIVAALLWLTISWFRNSRARMALLGVAAIGALFLVARGLELQLTTWLLQGFFAVVALMLVVVFQDDLRRLFEGIAVWGLRRGAPRPSPDSELILVRLCFRFAQEKIGALIVLPGREPLERHLDGGVYLDGRISEPLLISLFDPHTPGHDGAVIVRANKVTRFGVHLPLSTDWDRVGNVGTRHAAALGLAERSDAFCLVVSEERGEVSVARGGELKAVGTPEQLAEELRRFIERSVVGPRTDGVGSLLRRVRRVWREGVVAALVAAGLWYVAIPGGAVETVERSVPVVAENLPDGFELVGIEPPEVEVRLQGRRRDLYLASADDVSVHVDALLVQLGRRTFEVTLDQVRGSERVQPMSVEPKKVRLTVRRE
jgi:diadenylate cyclase